MNRNIQKATALTLVLIASMMLLAISVNAQTSTDALVTIAASAGGTTIPPPGNYTYTSNQTIMLTAVPGSGFQFSYWIVEGAYIPGHTTGSPGYFTDPDTGQIIQLPKPPAISGIDSLVFTANPANITCGYGYNYTYQAVFAPVSGTPSTTPPPQTQPPTNTSQGVIILPSIGGTTSPVAGSYVYANASGFTLSATPASGYAFHYWIVVGSYTPGHLASPQYIPGVTDQYPTVPSDIYVPNTQDSLVFSTNPATITCGYGYTYTYQAVFVPENSTIPPIPTSTPTATQTPAATTPAPTTAPPTSSPSAEVTATPGTSGGLSTAAIAAIVIVIIVIIIIIAAVAMMMRRKK